MQGSPPGCGCSGSPYGTTEEGWSCPVEGRSGSGYDVPSGAGSQIGEGRAVSQRMSVL